MEATVSIAMCLIMVMVVDIETSTPSKRDRIGYFLALRTGLIDILKTKMPTNKEKGRVEKLIHQAKYSTMPKEIKSLMLKTNPKKPKYNNKEGKR
jgi:hypothetical protein